MAEDTSRYLIESWASELNHNPFLNFLVGIVLLGVVGYQLYIGEAYGRTGRVRREETPLYYWFLMVIEIIFGLVFLSRVIMH
jgi:hypothetical protein